MTALPNVRLLGKPGCTLCMQAEAVVAQVCTEMGVPWTHTSILDDQETFDRFWDKIPVLLIDDEVVDYWQIDSPRLQARLSEYRT